MSSRRQRDVPWNVLGAGAVVLVALGGYLVLRSRPEDPSADPSTAASGAPSSVAALEALLEAPAGSAQGDFDPTKAEILSKPSLADAIAYARPMMTNTLGRLDPGAAMLAVWASKYLTWQTLEALPETSPALFKKDPDAERGKRLCIAGTLVEIRAEKTLANRVIEDRSLPLLERSTSTQQPSTDRGYALAAPTASAATLPSEGVRSAGFAIPDGGKVYVAMLQSRTESPEPTKARTGPKDALFVEIIAVKSSGTLVDGSDARVCGVLTGVTVPPAGATTSAAFDAVPVHRIVGMFDLPQNRTAGGGEVAVEHGG